MSDTVQIRPARETDCAAMLSLIYELAVYERAPHEVTVTAEHFRESGFGPHPVWWAFVAVHTAADGSEQVVGFALYYIRYSTWKGQRMYLEDILVTESWRGKGVGKLLMDALVVEGRQKQLSGVTWQVLEWNEPAINFYQKYNAKFDAEWINVSIEL